MQFGTERARELARDAYGMERAEIARFVASAVEAYMRGALARVFSFDSDGKNILTAEQRRQIEQEATTMLNRVILGRDA